jgi:hypothetical protein
MLYRINYHRGISGNERKIFRNSLGNKHPVKGISMVEGELTKMDEMSLGNRQFPEATFINQVKNRIMRSSFPSEYFMVSSQSDTGLMNE